MSAPIIFWLYGWQPSDIPATISIADRLGALVMIGDQAASSLTTLDRLAGEIIASDRLNTILGIIDRSGHSIASADGSPNSAIASDRSAATIGMSDR